MSQFVRLARVDDTAAMASLALAAWRVGFHELIPDELLTALSSDQIAGAWQHAIINPPSPGHRVLVATDAGVVRGYAAIAPASDPDMATLVGVVEIVDLVVAPNAVRQGHGSRLLHACADYARDGGATSAVTWVSLVDEARRAFFQSQGFGPDGALRELEEAGTTLKQVRLATSFEDA